MDVKKKIIAGVATVAIVGGVSAGAYAAVNHDKSQLADTYATYEKAYAQVEKKMKNLTPINNGCVVDMNDETLNPLCEDLDTAIKAVPEKVKVDVDKVARDDVDKVRAEVTKAHKALDTATADVNKVYEIAEPKLEAAREVFVAEVDKVIEETKTFIKDAQVIIDTAKETGVDASELETAKANAEKTVATLEGDRDTMRRSTHTETVTELNTNKESVETLTAATLMVIADKDEAKANTVAQATGERVTVNKSAEKVVEAKNSGKLNIFSGVGAQAYTAPKTQATAQNNYKTYSGQTIYHKRWQNSSRK